MPSMPDRTDAYAALRPIGWSDDAALIEAAAGRPVARVTGQHRSGFEVAEGPEAGLAAARAIAGAVERARSNPEPAVQSLGDWGWPWK